MLDEADQLLEMGFRPAIERVLSERLNAGPLVFVLVVAKLQPPRRAWQRLSPAATSASQTERRFMPVCQHCC